MKPRLRAEELTGMISLLRDKFVRSENLRRCCFVPMRRNSVMSVSVMSEPLVTLNPDKSELLITFDSMVTEPIVTTEILLTP